MSEEWEEIVGDWDWRDSGRHVQVRDKSGNISTAKLVVDDVIMGDPELPIWKFAFECGITKTVFDYEQMRFADNARIDPETEAPKESRGY